MRRFRVIWLILLVSLVVISAHDPVLGYISEKPSPAPSDGQSYYLETQDGYYVAAWYFPPHEDKSPGVILLHQRGADKSSWGDMPAKLVEEGFAVVAIDLRGHGETLNPEKKKIDLEQLTADDYQLMIHDVAAAHQLLGDFPAVDSNRVAIIGASIGANLAMMYGAVDQRVITTVALSPGLDYFGLQPAEYLKQYGRRALYLIVAKGDEYAYQSCLQLEEESVADPVSLRPFEGAEHGTQLLEAHAGLDQTIITGWLLNHLPPVNSK
jgi:pimeloyl-ACP methyl ester carboxylesterase